MDALENGGVIRCDFGQNHDGWVELVGYHDLLNPSLWLARLKAKAKPATAGETGTRGVIDPLKPAPTSESPAETAKSFYDSQGGAEGAPH